jgi:dihydroorotate dehydrogenase (NAD+) catalytic subunit
VDLSVNLAKLKLKNPVMPSSGTFGYGIEFADFLNLDDLGAIIVKGTTLHPRLGNFPHRFTEIAGCAEISTIGLQNVGVESFVKEKLPLLRQFKSPVIVNIAGESAEEFVKITDILARADGIAIEVNLPVLIEGGDSSSVRIRGHLHGEGRSGCHDLPVAVCGRSRMSLFYQRCEEAGADAICPIFAITGMTIDIHTRKSKARIWPL